MIKVTNLKKKFSKTTGIENINIHFEKGKIYGLLGPNGEGKSTLIKCLTGIYLFDSGSIDIEGVNKQSDLLSIISYMPDQLEFAPPLKLKHIIKFLSSIQNDLNIDKLMSYLKKFKLQDKLKYSTLSKGQKLAFRFALTVSRDVPVYILDEPLSGIDPVFKQLILKEIITDINEENKLIILSTHELMEIEKFIDVAVVLKDSTIEGVYSIDELRNTEKVSLHEWYCDKFKLA